MASAVNILIDQNREAFPFAEARIEGFGKDKGRSKRKDLRFFDHQGKLVLCGEVKLPGTVEGQSAMRESLVADAAAKADNAGVQYFFTWNVNEFALWDRSLWERPWFERQVRLWRLPRTLANPAAVAREENLAFVKTHFLPDLLHDLADFISGRRRDWLPPDDIFIRSLESHLDWPVYLLSGLILEQSGKSKPFDLRVQRWMMEQGHMLVSIPEDWPATVSNDAMFAPNTVYFGKGRKTFRDYPSRGQAELVARLANLGLSGDLKLPTKLDPCFKLLARVDERVARVRARFEELAANRTSDEKVQGQLVDVLQRWFVLGRQRGAHHAESEQEGGGEEPAEKNQQ